jgi:hypothetical protein
MVDQVFTVRIFIFGQIPLTYLPVVTAVTIKHKKENEPKPCTFTLWASVFVHPGHDCAVFDGLLI